MNLLNIPGFAVGDWRIVQNNPRVTGAESLTLEKGPIAVDIVAAPGSRSDRGRYDVYTKVDYNLNAPSLTVITEYQSIPAESIPHRYSDVRYFFSLECAVADVQNWLAAVGVYKNTGEAWQFFHPISYETNEEAEGVIKALETQYGYRGYFVNGPDILGVENSLKELINYQTFILRGGDCGIMIDRTYVPQQNTLYGNLSERSTFYRVSVMQRASSIDIRQIDSCDMFPRKFFSIKTAVEETQLWLNKFWGG